MNTKTRSHELKYSEHWKTYTNLNKAECIKDQDRKT